MLARTSTIFGYFHEFNVYCVCTYMCTGIPPQTMIREQLCLICLWPEILSNDECIVNDRL